MSSQRALDRSPEPAIAQALAPLLALLSRRRFAILTGAGCSTESGIPDYRGPTGSLRRRPPIQHREFVGKEAIRRRYWARSAVGWPMLAAARPGPAHHAIAALGRAGALTGLITQNVDGLHRRAGSGAHVELHGSIHLVLCLSCGARSERAALQDELLRRNPGIGARLAAAAPDGDAELADALVEDFEVPACGACGGVLKPDVVFFGDNVPRARVDEAWAQLDGAEALLCVGSSLMVFSGFRFARGAVERGLPLALLNQGPTRADGLAAVKVEAPAGAALTALAEGLGIHLS